MLYTKLLLSGQQEEMTTNKSEWSFFFSINVYPFPPQFLVGLSYLDSEAILGVSFFSPLYVVRCLSLSCVMSC